MPAARPPDTSRRSTPGMNSRITTAAPRQKEQEPKTRHIKNSNSPALFAVFLQIGGGSCFVRAFFACFILASFSFSRFILASLCSFVKARSGGPWQITSKLGSQHGQRCTSSGTLSGKLGALVGKLGRAKLNTPHPSSLAITTPCFPALALSRAKINTPCPLHAFGIVPSGGSFPGFIWA